MVRDYPVGGPSPFRFSPWPSFPPASLPPVDGLIVLGARLNPQGQPGRVARLRLLHALHLWRHHYPRCYLLLTGGCPAGARCSEARAMADWSIDWVADHWDEEALQALRSCLLLEEASLNTSASARHTLPLVQAAGSKAVGLVSDSFHIRRARFLFQRHFAPQAIQVHPLAAAGLVQHYWRRRRYLHLGKMALREGGAWLKVLAQQVVKRPRR